MEYLGNCIDSFDEDGLCINDALPWGDVNEFACAVEDDDNCIVRGVIVKYDEDADIHSFYRA